MKLPSLAVAIVLIVAVQCFNQSFSSGADVITTYSQNGRFYLKSIPYDNESPSLRGKTSVYEAGKSTPFYVFQRGFDSNFGEVDNLVLSNDGEVIFYALPWGANETQDGLKSITIYRHGTILKSFTESEVTGCDDKKERCDLLYSNYDAVVDREKSRWGTGSYKKVFKPSVNEQERFLSDYPIFASDDVVYLTDSKKNVHFFDLKTGDLIRTEAFEKIYDQTKNLARFNKTETIAFDVPMFPKLTKLAGGESTKLNLAKYLGMKVVDDTAKVDEQYKWYRFKVNGYLFKDGHFEIEGIEFFDELPKEKILEFFKNNKFDSHEIPTVADRWYFPDNYFEFRKADNALARREKQQEIVRQREDLKKRLVAEKIQDIYIPKNLEECFMELDRLLPEVEKKEMLALANRDEMIKYHMGLGLWMRNNWGLWGGSRLQAYFTSRGVGHPDEMSSVILFGYFDWLKGDKEAGKTWEKRSGSPRPAMARPGQRG